MKTTYPTFFKICPREFIEAQNLQEGFTVFKNRSRVDWIHLDGVGESTLRGFEVNSALVDQAEEEDEATYDILDSRIGRWDKAEVPKELLSACPNWPISDFTGNYLAPSYHLNLCNPDTQFHHLYRHYHPDSLAKKKNHFFVEGQWDPKLSSKETYEQALNRDDEWVAKYIRGEWGVSNAQIHRVWPQSYLEYSEELIDLILKKGNLFRILDHGDSSPTCCLWVAALYGLFIVYREYYVPNKVISEHRRALQDLSEGESYSANYADPAIFKKEGNKEGAFWTVAAEYLTKDIPGKAIAWIPADNNEFATRNRINELLKPNESRKRLDGSIPSSGIFFIKRSTEYPYGCFHSINELGSQRRKLIGYFEGKAIYSDDREDSVADHAYDCIRYFVAMHGSSRGEPSRKVPRNSIKYYKELLKRRIAPVAASVG